jgi:3-oxoacyl-[acyl-carrier protein] reductase
MHPPFEREHAGHVALVTGSGRGIGFGIASRLAESGAAVVVFDIDGDRVAQAVERIGQTTPDVLGVVGDVTRGADFERAAAAARERFGTIDILVNNAGMWIYKRTIDHTDDDFDRTIAINLKGTFLGCRALLPGMMRARWGRIVNISSLGAFHVTMPHVAYAAAKAGVVALTREVAFEAAPYGITVNAIAPGSVPPPSDGIEPARSAAELRRQGFPIGVGTPADIAEAVAFLASDRARYIVGVTIPVAGGADLPISFGRLPEVRQALLADPELDAASE